MDKNSIMLFVSPQLSKKGCLIFEEALDSADEKRVELFSNVLPMVRFKNPILALVLELLLSGIGRLYIGNIKFALFIWALYLSFFFLRLNTVFSPMYQVYIFLFVSLAVLVTWVYDIVTIFFHAKQKNLEILLNNLKSGGTSWISK